MYSEGVFPEPGALQTSNKLKNQISLINIVVELFSDFRRLERADVIHQKT